MDERKIQKETREVLFKLSDGSSLEGNVFLRLYEAHHTGPQKVGDLLNEDKPFIPVRTQNSVVLLNVANIVLARTGSEWEEDDLMKMGNRSTVWIKAAHLDEIVGDIFINLPDGFTRVKDYVNQPFRFFPLFQPKYVVYINQRYILSVRD